MRKSLFYLFFMSAGFMLPSNIWSQGTESKGINYHVAYYGNTFINPGLSFQIESTLKEKNISILNYPFRTEYIGNATIAGYWDPFAHIGFQYFVDYSRRLYLSSRVSLQVGAGLGWMMIFLSDSYSYNDFGEIKKNRLDSYGFVVPEISSGWRISNKDCTRSFGSRFIIHFPWRYNLYTIPSISYELSYQF